MDVADLISSQGNDFQRASGGRELILSCSFCDRPKLYVNAETGMWICQRCGERGNLWTLATRVLGLDNYDAFRLTREIERGLKDAPRFIQRTEERPAEEISLPDGFRRLVRTGDPDDEAFWHYLLYPGLDARGVFCRGLSPEVVLAYDIGYGMAGVHKKRVIIPVRQDGVLRSFVARSIHDECPACHHEPCDCRVRWRKVLHPEDVSMAKLLFNIDRMRDGAEIVLMEGVFDVLRLPNQAVCSFGAHLSSEQRSLIRSRTDRVVLCWDGDDVGRAGALRVAHELVSDLIRVRIAELPIGADPGSLEVPHLKVCIEDAKSFDLMSPKGLTRAGPRL